VATAPHAAGHGYGRNLTQALLDIAQQRGIESIRLLQAASNYGSFSLYAKLGFRAAGGVVTLRSSPKGDEVRSPAKLDVPVVALQELDRRVTGIDRGPEIQKLRESFSPLVACGGDQLAGYLFEIKGVSAVVLGPGAAEADDTLWLLLQLARESTSRPLMVRIAQEQHQLIKLCLDSEWRVVKLDTLMVQGTTASVDGAHIQGFGFPEAL
jgi:hypothetical protein